MSPVQDGLLCLCPHRGLLGSLWGLFAAGDFPHRAGAGQGDEVEPGTEGEAPP